jgi:hypothetical protein
MMAVLKGNVEPASVGARRAASRLLRSIARFKSILGQEFSLHSVGMEDVSRETIYNKAINKFKLELTADRLKILRHEFYKDPRAFRSEIRKYTNWPSEKHEAFLLQEALLPSLRGKNAEIQRIDEPVQMGS